MKKSTVSKTAIGALALTASLSLSSMSTPALADRGDAGADVLILLLFSTTLSDDGTVVVYDQMQASNLIDQAYAGSGEKLDALARISGQAVETVADRIVALDRAGEISASDPVGTAAVIQREFAPAK